MNKEPLTALEVDAITRFLEEKLQDIKLEQRESQEDFNNRFNTNELIRCDSSINRQCDMSHNRGFYDGIGYVLKILTSRVLP